MRQQFAIGPLRDIGNPLFDASFFAQVNSREAKVFHVLGRRAGFNSTAALQDVAEFLSGLDLLPELTGVENLELVSSSAQDNPAGTGTGSVKLTYINTNNDLVTSAAIALNGLAAVAVPFKMRFMLWMESASGGTSETSVGTILLRIAGGGATHEQISAGGNRSLSNRFFVPAGFDAWISTWQVNSIGGATQDARLRATVQTDRSLGTRYLFQDQAFVTAGAASDDLPWLKFPPLCRIKVSTFSSNIAGTNRIDSDFSILLVKQ